jgi:hypothetical protein
MSDEPVGNQRGPSFAEDASARIGPERDDGSHGELSAPHTASVDRTFGVFGLNRAVTLTLYWWADEPAPDS